MKKIWRQLKKLSFNQLKNVIALFILKPHYTFPLLKATKQCITMATKNFGDTHHKNNQANAYRHALWNMLIAYHTVKINKNIEKTLAWSKTITDWHEETFKNSHLEKIMDLHNNKMGRIWFEKMYQKNHAVTVTDLNKKLIKELEFSKKITDLDIEQLPPNTLVFIQ